MLIHERFVFMHLQRTGGTFLSGAMRQSFPQGSLEAGAPGIYHPGWDRIPPEARGRRVLVYVRNPWDWYVSWYHAMLEREPERPLFKLLTSDGARDFETVMQRLLSFQSYSTSAEVAAVGSRSPAMKMMLDGTDLYSARFLSLLGEGVESELVTYGRFESLVPDFERFLDSAGVELDEDALATIRSAAPVNASSDRRPYREYYGSRELRRRVGEQSSLFTERFGYRF